jgi:hypothetical protein
VVPIDWSQKLILAKVSMPLKTKYVDMLLLLTLGIIKTRLFYNEMLLVKK